MRSISLLYFAALRERVGTGEERLELPSSIDRVDRLIAHLAELDDRHGAAFARPAAIRCAVNQDFARLDTPIAPGDEVAFFPPVTGG